MTFQPNNIVYSPSQGLSKVPGILFRTRDPTSVDVDQNFELYTVWVNTLTKAMWYLESLSASNGVISALWRAVGPIVVSSVGPASPLTASADYSYPIGQTWVDSTANDYYVMVSNPTATTGYWIKLSAGTQGVDLLAGNTGGNVGPNASGVINVVGDGTTITIAGNPGTNTLTASLVGGGLAIDSIALQTGTTPCVPDGAGLITFNGAVVAAGTNPVRTNGTAANTMALQVQTSQALAATDATKIGLSNFNSTYFTCDANGFVSTVPGAGFRLLVTTFIINGTWNINANTVYAEVMIVGGGGAGGGAEATTATQVSIGSGGGAGEYAYGVFSKATLGVSQAITIGSAGASSVGAAGGNGGTTSVGALLSSGGGTGGQIVAAGNDSASADGSAGGTGGAGGSFRCDGDAGGASFSYQIVANSGFGMTGAGGSSKLGPGGKANAFNPNAGTSEGGVTPTSGYGGGGSGAYALGDAAAVGGGNGASGIVITKEYIFA